jgi:hypothetical protein
VPLGYWPIIVVDKIGDPDAAGMREEHMGQPCALVQAGPLWSLAASHECLEMLVDPSGNRTVAGYAPSSAPDQTRVEFLLEVCDPCEDVHYSYSVNGVPVSDFYTPHYFDPCKSAGVRYDFANNISRPREVLPNGYLSWHDPVSDRWWQLRRRGWKEETVPLGGITHSGGSIRSVIDRKTRALFSGPIGVPPVNPGAWPATFDRQGCPACPSNQSFGDMLRGALKNGKLLSKYGNHEIGDDAALKADADAMEKGIKKMINKSPAAVAPGKRKPKRKKR